MYYECLEWKKEVNISRKKWNMCKRYEYNWVNFNRARNPNLTKTVNESRWLLYETVLPNTRRRTRYSLKTFIFCLLTIFNGMMREKLYNRCRSLENLYSYFLLVHRSIFGIFHAIRSSLNVVWVQKVIC